MRLLWDVGSHLNQRPTWIQVVQCAVMGDRVSLDFFPIVFCSCPGLRSVCSRSREEEQSAVNSACFRLARGALKSAYTLYEAEIYVQGNRKPRNPGAVILKLSYDTELSVSHALSQIRSRSIQRGSAILLLTAGRWTFVYYCYYVVYVYQVNTTINTTSAVIFSECELLNLMTPAELPEASAVRRDGPKRSKRGLRVMHTS